MFSKKYLGVVEYVGKNYYGWQNQGQKATLLPSISGVLESVLDHILRKPVEKGLIQSYSLQGSSRTDKGVHAIANTFHIEFNIQEGIKIIPPISLIKAFNKSFKKSNHLIRVKDMTEVDNEFHARYTATYRRYIYKIYLGKPGVFVNDYYWVLGEVNFEKLNEGLQVFNNPINPVNISKTDEKRPANTLIKVDAWIERKNNTIEIHYKSIRFFWHQVRYMTGALLDYSSDRISHDEFSSYFTGMNPKKPSMAPPEGLYLAEVGYNNLVLN